MNTSLVLICLVIAFAAIEAHPGMRGNGASGATNDRDPSNPAYRQEAKAEAKAVGYRPWSSSYTSQNGGSRFAHAQASNYGGGPVSSAASA